MDPRTRRTITLVVLALLVVAVIVGALFSGGGARAAGTSEQALADRFVPVVVVRVQEEQCGPGEPYRPVPATSVLERSDVLLRGPDGSVVDRAPKAQDLKGLGDGYYLDFPGRPLDPGCDYEEWFRSMATEPTTVHARVTTDADHPGMLALQYWFFWVFNDWNDKHEGDWEMVQLLFAADSIEEALSGTPVSVAFAQHEGSEVSSWDDPKLLRDGDHVAVYPGEGSHAAYFTQAEWFGKSAAAGFGCDNTGLTDGVVATELRPRAEVVSGAEPWLEFAGRWGEKAPSFNNGPTGPNMKMQWDHPVSWQEEQGRPDAVALPNNISPAEEAFCELTAAGSLLFIAVLDHPIAVVVALLLVIVAAVVLIRSTVWRGSPSEPDSRRTAGQILLGPVGVIVRHPRTYGPVVVALALILLVSYLLQDLLQRPLPTPSLTTVGALDVSLLDVGLLVILAIGVGLLISWCVSVAVGRTGDLSSPGLAAGRKAALRGMWRTVVTYWVIGLLALSVVLLPLAAYLLSRWAVATPVAVLDGSGVLAAGPRSAGLAVGRRWRALGIMIGTAVLVTAPGPVLGALLLLGTPLPFWAVNLVAIVVTSFALCLAGISMTLHYYDLRYRIHAPGNPTHDPGNPTHDPGNPTHDPGNPTHDPGTRPDDPHNLIPQPPAESAAKEAES